MLKKCQILQVISVYLFLGKHRNMAAYLHIYREKPRFSQKTQVFSQKTQVFSLIILLPRENLGFLEKT